MNVSLKLPLIVLLFLFGTVHAQGVQLGFRFEANGANVVQDNKTISFDASLFGLQINASVFPVEKLSFEARAAINFGLKYYGGTEAGLFAKYYFTEPAYIIAGVINHKIITVTQTTEGSSWYSNDANLIMPAIGLGVNLLALPDKNESVKFDIELMYQYAGNKVIGHKFNPHFDNLWYPIDETLIPLKLNYALKIGIGASYKF